MSKTRTLLIEACKSVRRVQPSRQDARRLKELYERSYVSDEALFAAAQTELKAPRGIDGMTEPITDTQILTLLEWPQTVALEIPDPATKQGPPLAFVINHYANRSSSAVREFRQFMLSGIFDENRLSYLEPSTRERVHAAFEVGNIVYFGECVSLENPRLTAALVTETYRRVVRDLCHAKKATVVGKCLERIEISPKFKNTGNCRAIRFAESIGLRSMGEQVERRHLSIPDSSAAHSNTSRSTAQTVNCDLVFGLYLGDTERLRQRLIRRGMVEL